MYRTVSALLATVTAILGVAGVASLPASASPPPVAHASAANVDAAVRAVRTARNAVGGKPYSVDRERFRGAPAWEVDLARATGRSREVIVSANGRRVLRRGTSQRSADAVRARRARVGIVAAMRTAARRANGRLEDADIDRRRGSTVWSVSFERRGLDIEVDVNARSGRVVRVERDD